MAKSKTVYICQNCGVSSPKWIGRCPSCGEWNTYVEEVIRKESGSKTNFQPEHTARPQKISEITTVKVPRLHTGYSEFDRILGGGIVPGSMVLIGGEPGVGKSTLALQVALTLKGKHVLYVSGEESGQQIRLRAERLGMDNPDCYILGETVLENILVQLENSAPDLLVVDSVQTLQTEEIDSSAGSVSQIRECTARLLKYAKAKSIPVILIGHINKEGSLAGPKVLEHIVDAVFQFEGDRNYTYRILRSIKNRFGSTSEIGIFEMNNSGLREIQNPSEILISHHEDELSGVSIASTIDGIRPFLIETQALVSTAAYGTPQRSSTGFDLRRLNMLLAVLEKRAGFRLATKDVFLNIAGGLKVDDPAIDLAVVSAILSSSVDRAIDKRTCFSAEVGLSGEIRPVNRIENRLSEADKLGFKKIYISSFNRKSIDLKKYSIEVVGVSKIEQVFSNLFK
jgi:DNA repair protein RadA/Sms